MRTASLGIEHIQHEVGEQEVGQEAVAGGKRQGWPGILENWPVGLRVAWVLADEFSLFEYDI